MTGLQNDHKSHGDPNGGPIHNGQPPYWRRAHRDWRVWLGVVLMLAAMTIYIMTGDLSYRIHVHPAPPPPPGSLPP